MRQTFSEYHDPDEHLGLVGEDRADEFARPDRRLPAMLLTAVAMALFAGGLWFAYVQGTRHPAVSAPGDPVPLIRADERVRRRARNSSGRQASGEDRAQARGRTGQTDGSDAGGGSAGREGIAGAK